MKEEDPKERDLYFESYDIEWELYIRLDALITAKWDSNTLKTEIESLMKQYDKIKSEINAYHEKKDTKKHEKS